MELEWLEMKAEELRSFVDSNPLTKITDRFGVKMSRGEPIQYVIQNIEAQHKNIRDTLKDYALIIEAIGRLREKADQKKLLVRGDSELSPLEDGQI